MLVSKCVWLDRFGLAISLSLCSAAISKDCVWAQIKPQPDNTLGVSNSIVTPRVGNPTIDDITGGQRVGANLFHSFGKFDIDVGRSVFFTPTQAGIVNILTRVTGTNLSSISGILGVAGLSPAANLFLINPNGIFFGAGVNLDLQGSFISSTASSYVFADSSQFSTINPQPATLLAVNVPTGLQFGSSLGDIHVRGVLRSFLGTVGLLGGDIILNGGVLQGRRVELGSVSTNSLVGISSLGQDFTFNYSGVSSFKDIQLFRQAILGAEKGIRVQGQKITFSEDSLAITSNDTNTAGDIQITAKDSIDLIGRSQNTRINGFSFPTGIFSETFGNGNGGNINISTRRLTVGNGAVITSSALDVGKAGNININASEFMQVSGTLPGTLERSSVGATSNGIGDSGNINITTGRLILKDGGGIANTTFSKGRGGNLTINASESVEVSGVLANNQATGISTETKGEGNAGDLTITTKNLSVLDGGVITARTENKGRGGTLTVNASQSVNVIGASPITRTGSQLRVTSTSTSPDAGNAGNMSITTGLLTIQGNIYGNAGLIASTSGSGEGGTIAINANTLNATNGASILSTTSGSGKAGEINLNVTDSANISGSKSTLSVRTEANSTGNGGGITFTGKSLFLNDGAQITASTLGKGNAGDIKVNASNAVNISGSVGADKPSGILATTDTNGNGGSIVVNTNNLQVANNGIINAQTNGSGRGGDVTVNANDFTASNGGQVITKTTNSGQAGTVTLNIANGSTFSGNNSGLFVNADTNSSGNAGSITFTGKTLSLTDGATITVSTSGQGNAGDITVKTSDGIKIDGVSSGIFAITNTIGKGGSVILNTNALQVSNGGEINAKTTSIGDGGSITVKADSFQATNGGKVIATTEGKGNAGSITFNVAGNVNLTGANSGLFVLTEPNSTGNGGSINIAARNLLIKNGAQIVASTSGQGNAGDIEAKIINDTSIVGASAGRPSGIFAITETNGKGGNILLNTNTLSVVDRGEINAKTTSTGNGGSITVNANTFEAINGGRVITTTAGAGNAGTIVFKITGSSLLSGKNSGLFVNTEANSTGNGGDISIAGRQLTLKKGAQITGSTLGTGNAGDIRVNTPDGVNISGDASGIFALTNTNGKGGSISVNTNVLRLSDNGVLNAQTNGAGNGGNISFTGKTLSIRDGAQIVASTFGQGNAGDIKIDATELVQIFGASSINPSGIIALTNTSGNGGSITVNTNDLQIVDRGVVNAQTNGSGFGGNIVLNANTFTATNGGQAIAKTTSSGNAGSITLKISDSANLSGNNTGLFVNTDKNSSGNGGDITFSGRSLSLIDGAQVGASTLGLGNAGSIAVTATDSVKISGVSSGIFALTDNNGKGGGITINTNDLKLDDRGVLDARTNGSGNSGNITLNVNTFSATNSAQAIATTTSSGNAGTIDLNATDAISISGNNSGLFVRTEENSTGFGGNINVTGKNLAIVGGAQIAASSLGTKNAGNIQAKINQNINISGNNSGILALTNLSGQGGSITIASDRLQLTDGGELNARTNGSGKGGNILVNTNTFSATNSGRVVTTSDNRGQAGDITLKITGDALLSGDRSGLFANTTTNSSGNGGSIFLSSKQLDITNGAGIVVNNEGSGTGGNINAQVSALNLDRGAITATTANKQGGNIDLQVDTNIFLRRNSQISATAGTAEGNGNGGNINMNVLGFIISAPAENNDITANAFTGTGGNIQITTQGILGMQFQRQQSPFSDITASSQFGVEGIVQINAPNIDPTKGLTFTPLPPGFPLIAQSCRATSTTQSPTSRFINSGRGGLPPNPNGSLDSGGLWRDPRWPTQPVNPNINNIQSQDPYPEAQGWVRTSKRTVKLVTTVFPTNNYSSQPQTTSVNCYAP